MRFATTALASVIMCVSSLEVAEADQQHIDTHPTIVSKKQAKTVFADDQKYWSRLLNGGYLADVSSLPLPMPSPVSVPKTSPPNLPPIALPVTEGPTGQAEPCEIDVELKCTLASDSNTSCDTLEEVVALQCRGCAPKMLCFTYTAAACSGADNLPPGMHACSDFNGGPQQAADITISNGSTLFVDGTFESGAEFCANAIGDELPTQLFVFINAPGGGMTPEPNQIAMIDSACVDEGLTLLKQYGALQLNHYANCNGDYSCFVPIVYHYEARNLGESDLIISQFDRTFNEITSSLIEDANPADLLLAPGQTITRTESITADCCSESGYSNTANVTANDDRSMCHDGNGLNLEKLPASPSPTVVPIPSTPEPTSSTIGPSMRPSLTTLEPTQVTAGPSITTSEPTKATPKPSVRSEMPSVATEEPTFATTTPTQGSEQPTIVTPAPSVTTPAPTTQTSQQPTGATLEPSVTTPTPTSQQPTVTTQEPSIVTLEPTQGSQEPPAATPEPTQASEQPSQTTEGPSMTTVEPTTSFSPSGAPSHPPSHTPSGAPSNSPSSSPTLAPVPITLVPSIGVSESPSAATSNPSMIPSAGRSNSPSIVSPVDACAVSIDFKCIPFDGSEDCDSIGIPDTRCEQQPFALVFRYNGGTCPQSFNLQPQSVYHCDDFGGGPPTIDGENSYITVTDTGDRGTVYHEGLIPVGGELTVSDNGNALGDNLNVTVYRSENTSPENVLQTMVLQSSCNSNLFLKDRFGSIQLAIYANDQQGVQSCFFDVVYEYTVRNVGEENDAILQSLESQTNLGTINLTASVDDIVVPPGNITTFNRTVRLDLTTRHRYTIDTMLVAFSTAENVCTADDFFSFEAGNPLPPTIPTLTPTFSPTSTPVPTSDPEETSCELLSLITCAVVDGPEVACDELRAPTVNTCLGGSSPYELIFLYDGAACPTNPENGFRCNDRNGGPANRTDVWVTVTSSGETVLSEAVNKNNFVHVRGAIDQTTDLTISSVVDNAPAIMLQTMRIRTRCQEEDGLTLLNSYGALQLIGFANGPSGSQSILATVQVTYQVSILGTIRAIIQRAESIGDFAGERILRSTPSNPLGRRDVLNLGVESRTIHLAVNSMYDFSLIANGTSAPNPALDCSAAEEFSFTVLPALPQETK